MSTPGSVRSGAETPAYTPPQQQPEAGKKPKRVRLVRWQGIIPLVLLLVLAFVGWTMFGERLIRGAIEEAGTKALGAQLDVASVRIQAMASTVELRGVALADPFDRNRNLFEVGAIVVELEPEPLLEKKIVVRRLAISEVRTGTRRTIPAEPVSGDGFAPRALNEVKRFSEQFNVPLHSLIPLDSLKALVLDPMQLRAVQAALAVASQADSAKQSLERGYAGLRLQETLDSSAALVARLQGTNVRTLGLDGARRAVSDVRRAVARVDSARDRVEALLAETRRQVDSLQAGVSRIDAARREDYEYARSLLRVPDLDAPNIGAAVFGNVTIDRIEQAVYWSTLAREYAPPGLLRRESDGPERLRASGSTIRFITPRSQPRFLLRRADISANIAGGVVGGTYLIAATNITSDPAIVGEPMLFAVRRTGGGDVDSLRITGSIDHVSARPREVVRAEAAGVKLPTLTVPALPYKLDLGRGRSELRFALDGEQLSGSWVVRSPDVNWMLDSSRARSLNTMESLVARVLTGVDDLQLTAEVSGTLKAPKLSVNSNLDRRVADRLRAVAGEEIAAAQARARAQVDRIVEERAAPVRARIAELRAEGERRVAEARAKLNDEKRKLDERLKALSGGLVGLPGVG